ncbi:MAG: polyphosphate kinase 2 family protein [Anaerolineae bacterium]|jgi:PPK2 family polyphosphate:nucleotide phosphotransferase|nr:polyphosphate kinase 2 family protein [Anaerolineae bacterium]
MFEKFRVKPGDEIKLTDFSANGKEYYDGEKDVAKKQAKELNARLEELQELMYAEGKRKLLVVLQGMDTSGKDSTIRYVFEGVNPQGVKVSSFKVPTPLELAHDYLWRIHQKTPASGQIMIFNRSHYEDVLVVRVHQLVPESRWEKRYAHIRNFEQMLVDEDTKVVKFFLHIDKEEQKERLLDRRDTPKKQWKFSTGDLKERELWEKYQEAYQDAINETSTKDAPWYIVPANQKWFRNLLITSVLVEILEGFEMKYPEVEEGIEHIEVV